MFENYDEIITVKQLMDILAIGKNTAYNILKNHEIDSFRIGRKHKIPRSSVQKYVMKKCRINFSDFN